MLELHADESIWLQRLLPEMPKQPWPETIISALGGQRILVTGAAGSIGSEIVQRLHPYEGGKLFGTDQNEYGIFTLDNILQLKHPAGPRAHLMLADIRDETSLRRVFEAAKPDLVIHAAALKHVGILQEFPHEALNTNVHGTMLVARLCHEYGVKKLINISTDKAADPINILGHTKRLAEIYLDSFYEPTSHPGQNISLRFGNVFFSSGSLIPKMIAQACTTGTLTLRNRDATRYFISRQEVANFAIFLASYAFTLDLQHNGRLFIPFMGMPVGIAGMVEAVASHFTKAGMKAEVKVTGLDAGEKQDEKLVGEKETVTGIHACNIQQVFSPIEKSADALELIEKLVQQSCTLSAEALRNAIAKTTAALTEKQTG